MYLAYHKLLELPISIELANHTELGINIYKMLRE